MKKTIKEICGLLIIFMFLNSCVPYKVNYMIKKADKIDKIAVVSTYIGPMSRGWTTDISFFNDKIKSISKDINLLFKDYVNVYRDTVVSIVKQNCNCDVIYGESLQKKSGFKLLNEGFNFKDSLYTNDENFPFIFQASNEINPFRVIKDKDSFLDTLNENQIKPTIQSLCQGLDVNYIFVTYSYLQSVPGNLYVRGRIFLRSLVFLYDKDGDCLAWGKMKEIAAKRKVNSGTPINGAKIEEYPEELSKFSLVVEPIIKEIITNYPNY